jgi:ketosteroid isomerase-like protein
MKPLALFGMIVLLGISAVAGAATSQDQLVAPIRQFIDAFNRGDSKSAAAVLAPGLVIIDDVSPHFWTAPNAFEAWSKALAAFDQAEGNTDGSVMLGKPTRVVVGADRGYVVSPTVYTFNRKGVAMREPAQIVCALQKGTTGWQITGWTWVGTKPQPVAGAAK